MARELAAERHLRPDSDYTPLVEVAEIQASPVPPAPAGETFARAQQMAPRPTIVAVGRNVAYTLDSTVEHAFAAAHGDLASSFVACSDRDAVELLMVSRADFALIGGQLSEREQHAGLRQTRLGVELFALAVEPESPLRSLSRGQVRQVLTGEVTRWQQLGFEGGAIVVVAPTDRALADRAARALMPGDDFAAAAVRVASERHVVDQLLQNKGAIAVVRVLDQPMEVGQKLLQIDWCPPTLEAFGYGTYPFGQALHLVTSGQPHGAGLQFLEFARAEDGRERFGRTVLLH